MHWLPVIIVSILIACGIADHNSVERRSRRTVEPDRVSCTVKEVATGFEVTCPDGSIVLIKHGSDGNAGEDGKNGTKGDQGDAGERGDTGETGQTGDEGAEGATGSDGQDGTNGKNGQDGETGEDGAAGSDGRTCIRYKRIRKHTYECLEYED